MLHYSVENPVQSARGDSLRVQNIYPGYRASFHQETHRNLYNTTIIVYTLIVLLIIRSRTVTSPIHPLAAYLHLL